MGTLPTPALPSPDLAGFDPAPSDESHGGISRRASLTGMAGFAATPFLAQTSDAFKINFGERQDTTGRPLSVLANTMGVCTVTSTTSGLWGQRDKVMWVLKSVGAKWIRSEIYTGNKGQVAWLNQLAANGIRTNMIMQDPAMKNATPEQLVSLIASSMPNACHSMEGANEWNLEGGANWASELRTHQQRIFRAARGNAATRNKPVVGPALGMRKGYQEYGNQSAYMDWGNIHLYTGGFVPGYRSDEVIKEERRVCGSKPVIVTETGWHNASKYKGTHNYTPEDVAGVYAPRLILEYFIRNVPKVGIYELIDDRSDPGMTNHEAHFGLVRNNWSPKPAFISLANMNQIINRQYRTSGARGGSLSFKFNSGPADLRSALVAREDGRFLLFLWRNVAIYDPNKRRYLSPSSATVSIDWLTQRSIRRYAPASSANALSSERSSRSTVSLKGEMQILEITPN